MEMLLFTWCNSLLLLIETYSLVKRSTTDLNYPFTLVQKAYLYCKSAFLFFFPVGPFLATQTVYVQLFNCSTVYVANCSMSVFYFLFTANSNQNFRKTKIVDDTKVSLISRTISDNLNFTKHLFIFHLRI